MVDGTVVPHIMPKLRTKENVPVEAATPDSGQRRLYWWEDGNKRGTNADPHENLIEDPFCCARTSVGSSNRPNPMAKKTQAIACIGRQIPSVP